MRSQHIGLAAEVAAAARDLKEKDDFYRATLRLRAVQPSAGVRLSVCHTGVLYQDG